MEHKRGGGGEFSKLRTCGGGAWSHLGVRQKTNGKVYGGYHKEKPVPRQSQTTIDPGWAPFVYATNRPSSRVRVAFSTVSTNTTCHGCKRTKQATCPGCRKRANVSISPPNGISHGKAGGCWRLVASAGGTLTYEVRWKARMMERIQLRGRHHTSWGESAWGPA